MSREHITIQNKDDPSVRKVIWFKSDQKPGITYLERKSLITPKSLKKAFGKIDSMEELAAIVQQWKVIAGAGFKKHFPLATLFQLKPGKMVNTDGQIVKGS